jgi:predicted Zn-dependent peptidase
LVNKQELKKLCDAPMGVKQLSSSKEQLLGQIAMAEENNVSFMMMMARNILDQGRVTSMEEIFDRVKNISPTVTTISNEMFDEDKLSYLIMEPAHGVSA